MATHVVLGSDCSVFHRSNLIVVRDDIYLDIAEPGEWIRAQKISGVFMSFMTPQCHARTESGPKIPRLSPAD